MIAISGVIEGLVTSIRFEPTRARFKGADGVITMHGAIYARLSTPEHGRTQMSVELPDDTELVSAQPWSWLCYENSDGRMTMFVINSHPGTLSYAAVRPRRGL